MHVLRTLLKKYEWVHLTLGLIGNTCFVVGSVLFLWESTKSVGIWLFIAGSSGMWIGAVGSAIVGWERHHQKKKDHENRRRHGRKDART